MFKIVFIVFLLASVTFSEDALSLTKGTSKDSVNVYRLSLRKYNHTFYKLNNNFSFTLYFEISANYWKYDFQSVYGISASPIIRIDLNNKRFRSVFLELGTGIGYFSRSFINRRNLSTNYQFEDRIGIGFNLNNDTKQEVSFHFIHYSNANLILPNDGIDFFTFIYTLEI